jgi:hypothetical protein
MEPREFGFGKVGGYSGEHWFMRAEIIGKSHDSYRVIPLDRIERWETIEKATTANQGSARSAEAAS